ncbi:putative BOI-related E3 ubiquitin-protein ligase 3 isoform X2 [Curcuma longa]|uniref:putative BOI-related E3 ubiquitin-protein ligase 3 isoform X2 n=1 Tax=Curcuma longa TaxID=136217 RepID=UPI003D9DE37B
MHGFDHLLLHHGEKVSMELRNLFLRRILAAARRLKAEEDEIGRKRCLSQALEERVHRLRVEAQMWRDVALSLESVAGALRCDLDRGLAAAAVGDTESACCRSDSAAEANGRMRKRACRSCREAEPSVVLLPCRHLCVCAACAPATVACPVCSCSKRASVLVNTPH